MYNPGRFSIIGWLALWVVLGCGPAFGDEAPAGLVSQLEGGVTYQAASGGEQGTVQEFMQMYAGDTLSLEKSAKCQVIFYGSGLKETWRGPVVLLLQKSNSEVKSKDAKGECETTMLPVELTQSVSQAAIPLPRSNIERTGMLTVRSVSQKPTPAATLTPEAKQEIAAAESLYQRLAGRTGHDDVIAELYLIGVLMKHGAKEQAKDVVAKALAKRPDSEWLVQLSNSLR